MSRAAIRAALETALASIAPPLATVWENVGYTPTVGTPYQRVWMLWAQPVNDEFGPAAEEQGVMQVSLCFPVNAGHADAQTRAELIRSTFPRGATFVASGQAVTINRTTDIGTAAIEADRYVIPVRVRFRAFIPS